MLKIKLQNRENISVIVENSKAINKQNFELDKHMQVGNKSEKRHRK